MEYNALKEIVKKHHATTYGDIQSEVLSYGGSMNDVKKIYEEYLKNGREW